LDEVLAAAALSLAAVAVLAVLLAAPVADAAWIEVVLAFDIVVLLVGLTVTGTFAVNRKTNGRAMLGWLGLGACEVVGLGALDVVLVVLAVSEGELELPLGNEVAVAVALVKVGEGIAVVAVVAVVFVVVLAVCGCPCL